MTPIYTALANPGSPTDPRPFAGDPFEAAPPLIERLREVLAHTKGKGDDPRARQLRWQIDELKDLVPGPADVFFQQTAEACQRYMDENSIGDPARVEIVSHSLCTIDPWGLTKAYRLRDFERPVPPASVLSALEAHFAPLREAGRPTIRAVQLNLPDTSVVQGATLWWSGIPVRFMMGYNQSKASYVITFDVAVWDLAGNRADDSAWEIEDIPSGPGATREAVMRLA